jgi:hypothetical protein
MNAYFVNGCLLHGLGRIGDTGVKWNIFYVCRITYDLGQNIERGERGYFEQNCENFVIVTISFNTN